MVYIVYHLKYLIYILTFNLSVILCVRKQSFLFLLLYEGL